MNNLAFVKSRTGKPLMPCSRAKARHLLQAGKAKVLRCEPYTIKLLVDCSEQTQEVVAGMDVGSKNIGVCVVSKNDNEIKELFKEEVILNGDGIKKKMTQRKMYRVNRRYRKTRYRPTRFLNRASQNRIGRLAPSIKHKVDCHLKEKKIVESLLPVTKWNIETTQFDIHKISNPEVVDYQSGDQKGFYNTKEFILYRDNHTCQICGCKNKKLQVHHIIERSKGGTDDPKNLTTLCVECHDKVHSGVIENLKVRRSITKNADHVNIISSQIKKHFGDYISTFGYETKYKRELMGLPKTHYNDALAICLNDEEAKSNNIKLLNYYYVKKMVAKGDYKQTRGSRSEIKIPTKKLFGFRKFDKVKTPKGIGFVKAKRARGYFHICDVFGNTVVDGINAKKITRVSARKNYMMDTIKITRKD